MEKKDIMKNYYRYLLEQYYMAKGTYPITFDYVLGWYEQREYMLEEYASSLTNIKENSDRWIDFLNNTVEIGNVGKENTVSKFLQPVSILSPVGFIFDSPKAHTGNVSEDIASTDPDIVKFVRSFDTYITHNPSFRDDIATLNAMKTLAWQYPTVAISVYGNLDDKDRKQKLQQLRTYMQQIIALYGVDKIGKIISPIVNQFYDESNNGTYIATVISDQYEKLLLPDAILQSKLRNLPPEIRCARNLTIEQGHSRGM